MKKINFKIVLKKAEFITRYNTIINTLKSYWSQFYTNIKEILDNYWFWICGALALASFVSGYMGFAKAFVSDTDKDFLDFFYHTLQVFTFESLPDGIQENQHIKFAKILAPISIALFSFKAFYILFAEHLLMLKLRRYSGHVVICGLGTKGMLFVNKKLKEGKKVVVIEKSDENLDIPTCKTLKVPVIIGDATEDEILKMSRYEYASEIYIFTSNDISNIMITKKMKEKILCPSILPDGKHNKKQTNNQKLTCYVHIHNYELKHSLDKEDWINTNSDCFEIKIFNIYEMVARYILNEIPLEPSGKNVDTVQNPWVIVIGFGSIGSAIVRQLIRMKVYPKDKKLRITIIDRDAKQHEEIFHSMYYDPLDKGWLIFKNVDIAFVEKDIRKVHDINDLIGERHNGLLPHNIYICTGDDITTSILTHKLNADIPKDTKHQLRIIACFTNSALKSEEIAGNNAIIHKINIKEEGCISLIDLDKRDSLAKLIHSDFFNKTFPDYLKQRGVINLKTLNEILEDTKLSIFEKEEKIRKDFATAVDDWIKKKPSRKRWYELAEVFKNSNRLQADHINDKIRVLNPEFTTKTTKPSEIEEAIKDPNNLELLAELEYKRYWAEKFVARDKDYIKQYINDGGLKKFSELTDSEQNWNRKIIKLIPDLIAEYKKVITEENKEGKK